MYRVTLYQFVQTIVCCTIWEAYPTGIISAHSMLCFVAHYGHRGFSYWLGRVTRPPVCMMMMNIRANYAQMTEHDKIVSVINLS